MVNGKILVTYVFRLMEELLDMDSKRLGAQLRGELIELTEMTEILKSHRFGIQVCALTATRVVATQTEGVQGLDRMEDLAVSIPAKVPRCKVSCWS